MNVSKFPRRSTCDSTLVSYFTLQLEQVRKWFEVRRVIGADGGERASSWSEGVENSKSVSNR